MEEIERVEAAGGWIVDGRVCNILAVSRAFGDPEFKVCLWCGTEWAAERVEYRELDRALVVGMAGASMYRKAASSHRHMAEEGRSRQQGTNVTGHACHVLCCAVLCRVLCCRVRACHCC